MSKSSKKALSFVALTSGSAVARGPLDVGTGTTLNEFIDGEWWVPFVSNQVIVNPLNWGAVSAEGGIPAEFINHFNVDIKGTGSGIVGYLDETVFPAATTNIDNLIYDPANPGSANNIYGKIYPVPTYQNNVIGWTNPNATPPTEGYYDGSVQPHDFASYRIVVVTEGNKYHLIQVSVQGVESLDDDNYFWRSAIEYNYRTIATGLASTLDEAFSAELKPEIQFLKARLEKHLKSKK